MAAIDPGPGRVLSAMRLLLSRGHVRPRAGAFARKELACFSRGVERIVRHSAPRAFLYLLHASRPSPPQNVRHRSRRRISAAGEPLSVVDRGLFIAMPVGAATGGDSIWRFDAA